MTIRRVRRLIFLKDVLILSLTAFGGPQGHFALFLDMLVKKRGYLSEEELIELHALCQFLPGPSSTQTLTSIGFRIGGPNLAYLTLFFWILPAITIMTILAIMVNITQELNNSMDFLYYVQPMAVGIVALAPYRIANKVVKTRTGFALMIISTIACFFIKNPVAFPILILLGGLVTTWKYKKQPKPEKDTIKINWSNLILWISVLIFAATLGGVTQFLPVRLFENFYRNGSLIFGGGQVLVPMLYTEFVEFKRYLSSEEFVSGYGFVQAIPGPIFSFSAYVGMLSMREYTLGLQILGAFMSAVGVFLPGTFLIFFVIRFWDRLKKYRIIKASLEGVNAVSAGMIIAATILMLLTLDPGFLNYSFVFGTIAVLLFTKIPTPFIILGGVLIGVFLA